ncbi:hypothetical protein VHEMI02407 [[Torrubiella] hemipterigena]|uniref:Phosphatidic acid phosphatase type 2/haloperoxidase domain-containing protein n=1 Tax=[Torrubiella] hemipterigena TaxID=1531966 RepID=A0A0A1SVN1_9HYPO|nr:hypothetical protein VHEMI02407 [[Torrubiella] hemipterigena]
MPAYEKMATSGTTTLRDAFSARLIVSYVFDWALMVALVIGAYYLGQIQPNFRDFSLADRDISFPFTEKETVPNWLLGALCAGVPVIVILVVALVFVPGATVPPNTPAGLVWKRKLWELHIAWLGLLVSVGAAFFFVSGIKNMCGKPRPDMLARCMPDIKNKDMYQVGGFATDGADGRLYSHLICTQTDKAKLWDGFRSYPSGHAGASAAGLIYLSLYLASKFGVTIPFVVPNLNLINNKDSHSAFPSRAVTSSSYQSAALRAGYEDDHRVQAKIADRAARFNANVQSLRRQAAAPPVYLLAITLVPFCISIFISASRWFNYRHHGFDILFGFLIGTICAIYTFRFYHMPIQTGAGWAWAPRNPSRAFWAGVGKLGFGNDRSANKNEQPDDSLLEEGREERRFEQSRTPVDRHPQPYTSQYQQHEVEMQTLQGQAI